MRIIVLTPSKNQLAYLQHCVASVRDQIGMGYSVLGVGPNGEKPASSAQAANSASNEKTTLTCNDLNATASVAVHHHIQDGGSTDGTVEWLRQYAAEVERRKDAVARHPTPNTQHPPSNSQQLKANGYSFSYESAPDHGMYDALNRGMEIGVGCSVSGFREETELGNRQSALDVGGGGAQISNDELRILNSNAVHAASTQNPKPKTEYPKPKTEYPTPNTERPIPNTERLSPNTRPPMPKTEYPAPNTQYPIPNTENPTAILAWLNCDEQYLPGTLAFVEVWFAAHPNIDILTGNMLVVDEQNALLAARRGSPLRWPFVAASHLYNFSCATFFRQKIWEDGFRFDSSFASAGDEEFFLRVLRAGYRAEHADRYLAAFTWSGRNTMAGPRARAEEYRLAKALPRWLRLARGPLRCARWMEKLARGAYRDDGPIEYALYAEQDGAQRKTFRAAHASWRWPE